MNTIRSLYVASIKEFIRDRAAIIWTLAFPLIFIVLFGVIFNGNSAPNYTVGMINEDNGAYGTALASTFKKYATSFKFETGSLDSELNKLKQGQIDMVIVIPADTSQ